MEARREQIESELHATLGRLDHNFEELEHKVKAVTDWRLQFERRPVALVGLAFLGGALLAGLLGAGRGRR